MNCALGFCSNCRSDAPWFAEADKVGEGAFNLGAGNLNGMICEHAGEVRTPCDFPGVAAKRLASRTLIRGLLGVSPTPGRETAPTLHEDRAGFRETLLPRAESPQHILVSCQPCFQLIERTGHRNWQMYK